MLHISRDPAQLEALTAQEAEEAEAAAQAEEQLAEESDGEAETVEAEATQGEAAETDLEEEEEITAYARVGDSQIVYLRLSKKWLAPLFRGFHSSLAPTARPGSYAGKPLLRKAFCGFAVHAAKSD